MKHLLLLSWVATSFLLLAVYPSGPAANSTASTGAPRSATVKEQTCNTCHTQTTNYGVSATLELIPTGTSTPVQQYVPGQTYQLRLMPSVVTTPTGYGFQVTPVNLKTYTMAGSFSSPSTNTRLSNFQNRTYFEQSSRNNSKPFTVTWTAPAKGSGAVGFYASVLACNNNGKESGDQNVSVSLTINEQAATAVETDVPHTPFNISIFPNPSQGQAFFVASEPATIEVFSLDGRIVATFPQTKVLELKTQDWSNGIYIVRATSGANTLTRTIVKH